MKHLLTLYNTALSFCNSISGRWLIFICCCLLYLLHHYFVFLGFYNNDDINYARYAAQMASGNGSFVLTSDHFALRWFPIAATALCYRLFNINDTATILFSCISLFLTGLVLAWFVLRQSLAVFVFSLLLFFGNYNILFYTHRLLPDGGMCFLLFSAYLVYHHVKFGASVQSIRIYAALFAILNFLAVLTKETVIMIIPLYLSFLWIDCKTSKNRVFWIFSIFSMLLLATGYLFIFKMFTGDWFFRYHLLIQNSTLYAPSYDKLPISETIKRVLYLLWQNFLLNGDMICLLPGVCTFFYRKKLGLNKSQRHLAVSFMILLISADVMSISFSHYVPLLPDPRHFIFLIPFAAISGSYLLKSFVQKPFQYHWLPVVFVVSTIIMFVMQYGEMKFVYLAITILLLARMFLSSFFMYSYQKALYVVTLAAIFFIRPCYDVYTKANHFYFEQEELVRSAFPAVISKGVVYTGNDITAELCDYFLKFNTGNVAFKNLKRTDTLATENIYLLVNTANSEYLNPAFTKAVQLYVANGLTKIAVIGAAELYKVENKKATVNLKRYAEYY